MDDQTPPPSQQLPPLYALAGGRSSRFGSPKALAQIDGIPLILRSIAAFAGQNSAVHAVVDRADRLTPLDLAVVVDAQPQTGPVQGLLTALQHAPRGWLWLAPCDLVGVAPAWLRELSAARRDGLLALAWRAERWQPLPSLWHTDALPRVAAAVARGEWALWQMLEAVGAAAVPLPRAWSQVQRVDTPDAAQALVASLPVRRVTVQRWRGGQAIDSAEAVAVEAPLQVQLRRGAVVRDLGVTLRTPGHDAELAVGMALALGAAMTAADVVAIETAADRVCVELGPQAPPLPRSPPRRRPAHASCGACGLAELDVAAVVSRVGSAEFRVAAATLRTLPERLLGAQPGFAATGGLHAAALFDAAGNLIDMREDVGRHNALDKLLGAALLADRLPLQQTILLLSGRVAFELVQKAAAAGVAVVVAIGAPSSLAVELAARCRITLVGFARGDRGNVYTCGERVTLDAVPMVRA